MRDDEREQLLYDVLAGDREVARLKQQLKEAQYENAHLEMIIREVRAYCRPIINNHSTGYVAKTVLAIASRPYL